MSKEIGFIFCPPLSEYPEPPKDISVCKLVDCPHCKNKMWLSIKKEVMKELMEQAGKDILFACYPCFMKEAEAMKERGEFNYMTDTVRIDL